MSGRHGGLVLAGGSGRRLGRPKAGLVIEGLSLLERAVAMVSERCAEVVVVSRIGVPLPPITVPVVLDGPGPKGPMNALAAGLAALTSEDVVVLACDLPMAGPVIDRLIEVPGHTAAAASDGSRLQPLCARYPRVRVLEEVRGLMATGDFAMTGLAAAMGAVTVPASEHELLNVNQAEDMEEAARLLLGVTKRQGSVRGT
ncbi:MAG: molybdenum cofactor guanylyltransferase [Actinomycetota bacterium]|nr:molybdenum cofactor guanylyltransferase [Actinomycetota bacterium]